ncbi:MAG: hypothetical protein K2W82_16590 [Candidatus Obscuribacterales bacterium]|nr:hypothetical protein [Candidatus Obscuribacterales bacterium]
MHTALLKGKSMNVFVVVDAQDQYLHEADGAYIDRVAAAVAAARGDNDLILLLEYQGRGQTHRRILEVLNGYANFCRLTKYGWCGALQVAIELSARKIKPTNFRVGGLYSEQCVLSTVDGLFFRFPSVSIAVQSNICLPLREMNWQRFAARYPGVTVV